jgi:hypothetical protein
MALVPMANKIRKSKRAKTGSSFIATQHLQHIRWSTRAQGQVHPKIVCAGRQVKIMQTPPEKPQIEQRETDLRMGDECSLLLIQGHRSEYVVRVTKTRKFDRAKQ